MNQDGPKAQGTIYGSNTEPPTRFWKVAACMFYLMPWLDYVSLSGPIIRLMPWSVLVYFFPGPWIKIYYGNEFAPMLVFFLTFLCVVRNKKITHFVRFHAMQAVMIDIVVMLFQLLRIYFPNEIRYSDLIFWYDKCAWVFCFVLVTYSVVFCLAGFYADIPWISEACYIQVEQAESM